MYMIGQLLQLTTHTNLDSCRHIRNRLQLTVTMGSDRGKNTGKEAPPGPSFLPLEKAKSEKALRSHYTKQFLTVVLAQGPVIAWGLYGILKILLSSESLTIMNQKFDFLYHYELYYVYLAVFLIYLSKLAMTMNANGARAPTRLNRPDQQIYQVVGTDNMVLMATEGANGRFNRAQRANFNMEEGLPLFLTNTILVSAVLGPLVSCFLVPMYAYGRIRFAHDYKESCKARTSGFLYSMIAEHGMAALVVLIAVKAIAGDSIPI